MLTKKRIQETSSTTLLIALNELEVVDRDPAPVQCPKANDGDQQQRRKGERGLRHIG
jgi:hypothetical protein